jgi:hypothetical protein
LATEMMVASGQNSLMPPATESVIFRFVVSSSSRVGIVPSGRFVRGTPAVLMIRSEPFSTLYSLPASKLTSQPTIGVPAAMSRHFARIPPIWPPPINPILFSIEQPPVRKRT